MERGQPGGIGAGEGNRQKGADGKRKEIALGGASKTSGSTTCVPRRQTTRLTAAVRKLLAICLGMRAQKTTQRHYQRRGRSLRQPSRTGPSIKKGDGSSHRPSYFIVVYLPFGGDFVPLRDRSFRMRVSIKFCDKLASACVTDGCSQFFESIFSWRK